MIRPPEGLLDPRAFCGARYPWPLIAELTVGSEVAGCYVLQECRRAETKARKPYLRLLLGDRTGTVPAVVWEDAARWEPLCVPGAIVGVRGKVSLWDGSLQIDAQSVERLRAEAADLEQLLPASPRPRALMEKELEERISSVRDPHLRRLLRACLGPDTEVGALFRVHPAAKRNHHAYVGGLLEHSLSVAAACDSLAEHYLEQGVALDRDLLVTGALLHDVGKVRELRGFPAPEYTDEGQLLGHIVIGIQLVTRAAEGVGGLSAERVLLLQHLIASHQGKPEWDSPKMPQLVEALILHYADDLDAKLNQARGLLANVAPGEWSPYDRSLGRAFFQPAELRGAREVEPVPPGEAVELLMDLFQR